MKFPLKITILLGSIIVVAGVGISYFIYSFQTGVLKKQILFRLEEDAFHIMDKLDRMLFERFSDIQVFATCPVISSRSVTAKQITDRLVEYKHQYKIYASLSFFDSDRVRVADTSGLGVGQKYRGEAPWLDEALDKGVVSAATYVRVSQNLKIPVFYFAAPVKDDNGNIFGAVVTRIPVTNIYEIAKLIVEAFVVDLVDKDGLLLYSSYNRKGIFKDNLSDWEAVKRSLSGQMKGNLIHYDEFSKKEDIVVFIHEAGFLDFKGNDWTYLVHVPVEIAFKPAIQLRNKVVTVIFVIIFLALLVIYVLSKRISKPIAQLKEAAVKVGEGRLDTKIEVLSKDEIGDLAFSFNKMTEDLKESRFELLREKSSLEKAKTELDGWSKTLETRVEERTQDLNQSQEATLNMLEDLEKVRDELQETNDHLLRAKSEIERFSKSMESMVESMVEGVIMLDEEGKIVVFNPKARQMLGVGLDEEISRRILDSTMRRIHLLDALSDCIKKKRYCLKEVVVGDNEPLENKRFLRCEMSPVKNKDAAIIGVVIVLRDITHEKEIDRMKTEFISTVSHELRTPLSILKEGVSLVLDRIPGQINDKQEKLLSTVKSNIERLGRIINDLLDISKMEAGKLELKKQRVDIVALAEGIVASFVSKAKEKNLILKKAFSGGKISIYVDSDRIVQAFTNLVNNAIKFTNTGYIEISVKRRADGVECSVADTGVGISKEDIPKVFDKFQQFGRTAGGGEKGTGLGLAITKEIIEAHKGKIWVESQWAKGTKFTFVLPVFKGENLVSEYVSNALGAAQSRGKEGTLIIASVSGFDKLKKKISPAEKEAMFERLKERFKNSVRSSEEVLRCDSEFVVFLEGCSKKDSLDVRKRIKESFRDYLQEEKIAVKIKLGMALYPDDAFDREGLISKAKKGERLNE
ncbi:MAG: HAMP domain-containing protein [Candidatus Omnitrophota bacterium]|nr:MAG: HAMP domain-containing protein [Candidatus Omnitrophota bacterium]